MRKPAILVAAAVAAGVAGSVPAQAISGGTPAAAGSYAFVAKVDVEGVRSCTGALVAPRWILTAASCFPENVPAGKTAPTGAPVKATTVTVGRTDLSATTGHVAAVTDLIARPERNLVLARLATAVPGVTPVAISAAAPAAGDTIKVAGYGRTATEWVPDLLHTGQFTVDSVAGNQLNVTGQGSAAICKGDSGGPAFREVDGVAQLVALNNASWQGGCYESTETRRGATETRVDDIRAWIQEKTALVAECQPATSVFITGQNSLLRWYQHKDPAGGSFSWVNAGGETIGQGWLGARTIAGPNGVVYAAVENGDLRRFRWNAQNKSWDTFGGTAQYRTIDRGWERYASAAYRNRITVDTKGDIYTVEPDGKLHWRKWTDGPGTGSWAHRTLTGDWGQYDLIVAAGKGVIYSRKPNGHLFRHVYDADTDQWLQTAKPSGAGWEMFSAMFSAGGDTLYGAWGGNGSELVWYRYLPETDTWADTGRDIGRHVGSGWHGEYNLTSAPDGCELK